MAKKRYGPEEQVTQYSGQYSLSCTVFSTHTKLVAYAAGPSDATMKYGQAGLR